MSDEPISEFRIEERRQDGRLMLTVHGELDLASVDAVTARLDAARAAGEAVLLDLDELDFMDSSGLRMVFNAAETSDAWVPSNTQPTSIDTSVQDSQPPQATGTAEREAAERRAAQNGAPGGPR